MLVYRLRRWPNIQPTMGQCIVFAGLQQPDPPYSSEQECHMKYLTPYQPKRYRDNMQFSFAPYDEPPQRLTARRE